MSSNICEIICNRSAGAKLWREIRSGNHRTITATDNAWWFQRLFQSTARNEAGRYVGYGEPFIRHTITNNAARAAELAADERYILYKYHLEAKKQ